MARRRNGRLRVIDYSDLAVLHVIADHAGADGYAAVEIIADVLDVPERSVLGRMAWMVKYETVERDGSRAAWRPARLGDELLRRPLTKALQRSLDGASDAALVLALRAIRERGPTRASALLSREWRYQDAARRP